MAKPDPSMQVVVAVKSFLDKPDYRQAFAAALAKFKDMNLDHFLGTAISLLNESWQLRQCTPLSICKSLKTSAELGLEVSGPLGEGYLVPYYNKHIKQKEAQFQVGFRGWQTLAYRSERVKVIKGRVVYEGDDFAYDYGTNQFMRHKPIGPREGRKPTHVYAIAEYRDRASDPDFEVWYWEDCVAHRERYSKAKGEDSAWETNPEAMSIKTVIIPLAKRQPKEPALNRAASLCEYNYAGVPQPHDSQFANTLEMTKMRLDQLKTQVGADDDPGPAVVQTRHQTDTLAKLTGKMAWTAEQVGYFLEAWEVTELDNLNRDQAEQAIVELTRIIADQAQTVGAREPGDE